MRFVYFTHSLASCWNHGNAHFLRGILRVLAARGHDVVALEPARGWSMTNLVADHGAAAVEQFTADFPTLRMRTYDADAEAAALVEGADVVIVHEWTEPALVAAIGRVRRDGGQFDLLFHDTHHRGVSDPRALDLLDLTQYDGVLAFGASLAEAYRARGWGRRVFVWHEAADAELFRPPAAERKRTGLVWIGNWGDGERTEELRDYLLEPAARAGLPLDIHGVRYTAEALRMLACHGARYRGWVANARVPSVFARHLATMHVPRRYYATTLPGIPTIRMFEALACGIPLISAPWQDSENLFRPGFDYLVARDGAEAGRHLRTLRDDADMRRELVASGLETIRSRHTCAHRVDELFAILATLRQSVAV